APPPASPPPEVPAVAPPDAAPPLPVAPWPFEDEHATASMPAATTDTTEKMTGTTCAGRRMFGCSHETVSLSASINLVRTDDCGLRGVRCASEIHPHVTQSSQSGAARAPLMSRAVTCAQSAIRRLSGRVPHKRGECPDVTNRVVC